MIRLPLRRLYSTGTKVSVASAAPNGSSSAVTAVQTPVPDVALDVSAASGAPDNLLLRKVMVYRCAKTAMQSGNDNTRFWKLDWNSEDRWSNPLMGWASSADYMQATSLRFRSKEEAIRFAERQGWDCEVVEKPENKDLPKSYAKNFVYSPNKLRYHHTK